MPSLSSAYKERATEKIPPQPAGQPESLLFLSQVKIPGIWVALAEHLTRISTKQGKSLCPHGPKTLFYTRYQVASSGKPFVSRGIN